MAKPDRQQSPEIRRSEQAVQNWSFDEVYKVLSTVGLAEYANALYRLQADSDGNLKVNIASGTVDVDTTGLATETKQDDIITELQTIVPQTDALTDTQLRATPVSVSGTVTANLGTLNGAATAANQQTDALTDTELRATPVPVSGTVTATPTGTQNVDVTANTIGLATAANQLPDGHNVTVDNGIGAAAVPIQDGGNSITVDGTVAATQSGTWTEANSAAIKTAVETIDNAISGSEMQVDVVGALPAGTNAIGKLAANSGVDIGDVDVTSSVSSTLDHGSNLDIDTTAEQITSTSFAAKFGVTVKSAVDNTATVYIGNSDVTDGDTAATDGFPLEPGESITLPVTNSNLLYAIAASANQKVFWIGV